VIKRIIKYIIFSVLAYVLFCFMTPFNKHLRNRSIKNQINYLSEILDKGYDDQLQTRFPEGKIFSNALLALSTIEYCNRNSIEEEKFASIVDKCIKRMQSDRAKRNFDQFLDPQYGMFYTGWSSLVLFSYQKSKLFKKSSIKAKVESQSVLFKERLVAAMQDSIRPLDSYSGSYWPADNLIGLISLEDDGIKSRWLQAILNASEHSSGLIHHSGSKSHLVRGSSSAMITYCLSKDNYEFVNEYAKKYNELFIDNYLGIQLVKEHEDGSKRMDVDSGPIIFGYGASATIMNIKAQASLGSMKSMITFGAMNVIAFPINLLNGKYYLLKKEPMLDLFMLWGSVELGK